jgi:hypothetical protein
VKKNAVRRELFEKAGIYLNPSFEISVNYLDEDEITPQFCPKCEESLVRIYTRPEEAHVTDSYDCLIVFRCNHCAEYSAFFIEPLTYLNSDYIAYEGGDLSPFEKQKPLRTRTIRPVRRRKKRSSSQDHLKGATRKWAKAYLKKIAGQSRTLSKLDSVIIKSLQKLYLANLKIEIINSARNMILTKITKSKTEKQLTALFAAAIYLTSERNPDRFIGQNGRLSERQNERIFGVTRKTIRKWKKVFEW